MNDGDELDRRFTGKIIVRASIVGIAAYCGALFYYPDYWAVATGAVFVIASGLFTTKVVLSLENPWAEFGLAPIFGVGWLVFLWLLYRFAG